MIKYAGILLVLVNLTAILGFTAMIAGSATMANALFFLFLALIVIIAIIGTTTYKKTRNA